MRIAIFGMGYVGTVTAACLSKDGHEVTGVDHDDTKISLINAGRSPVVEKDIDHMIADAVANRRLHATIDGAAAVRNADLAIVCVGTPSSVNGDLDLSYVSRVCEEIGIALRDRSDPAAVVIRSTVLPGTLRTLVIPTLEASSGKAVGENLGVGFFPEFLREGSAVSDFYKPPKVVYAASDSKTKALLKKINAQFDAPTFVTDFETAEMVKYADNSWHALKVAFANEIGSISKAVQCDGGAVMEIFCSDTKLNLSPRYLRPGFAFGGSCLPKDVRALAHKARSLGLDTPLINSIIPSNERHIDRALRLIHSLNERRIGVLGLSFKAGTDDLRESPVVELVERLLGKGYEIRIFDRNVNLSRLIGANKAYIFQHLPHIAKLLVEDISEIVDLNGIVVVGNSDGYFSELVEILSPTQRVIDLVRVVEHQQGEGTYHGLCW